MGDNFKSANLTIMLTDIQGYSNTAAQATREEVVSLIRRHNQLMKPVIEFYGGTVVKSIGDAFLCTFESATDAVICAIIIQLMLKEYNQKIKDEINHLNLRIVLNSGDVKIDNNDIFGTALNITTEMEGLECFPGGTIGISESTALLMDQNEIVADSIGEYSLKSSPEKLEFYTIPIDKQKLNKLPVQLLNLVEKVAGSDSPGVSAVLFKEWQDTVGNFIRKTNWGERIHQVGGQINKVHSSLKKTFSQKTVIERKKELKSASLIKRAKAGAIDFIIIMLFTLLLNLMWMPIQRVMFGPSSISQQTFLNMSREQQERFTMSSDFSEVSFERQRGFIEYIIAINIRYPLMLIFLYFTLFWRIKKASLGQIASGTAVISKSGELNIATTAKRSALFLLSCFIVLGVLMVIVNEKKTLYDMLCQTDVVE